MSADEQLSLSPPTTAVITRAAVPPTAPTPERAPLQFVPSDADQAYRMARALAESGLLPEHLRGKVSDIFVTLLMGHELGLTPMQSIRGVYVVSGKPSLAADAMVALAVRSRDICSYFRVVSSDSKSATYETLRVGSPEPTRMSYTIEQARNAGLFTDGKSSTWTKHPDAMLRARCSSALARAVYPDLLMGVYDPDEAREFARGPQADAIHAAANNLHVRAVVAARKAPADPVTPQSDAVPPQSDVRAAVARKARAVRELATIDSAEVAPEREPGEEG